MNELLQKIHPQAELSQVTLNPRHFRGGHWLIPSGGSAKWPLPLDPHCCPSRSCCRGWSACASSQDQETIGNDKILLPSKKQGFSLLALESGAVLLLSGACKLSWRINSALIPDDYSTRPFEFLKGVGLELPQSLPLEFKDSPQALLTAWYMGQLHISFSWWIIKLLTL